MSFINSIIKVFVGDKSQKDVKALQGNVNKIKSIGSALESLSNDELRAKTIQFKEMNLETNELKTNSTTIRTDLSH